MLPLEYIRLIHSQLYTKAYELFKKFIPVNPEQNPVQGRLTLWIACRIAQTYFDSGKFDMAMRSGHEIRMRFIFNPVPS